MLAVQGSILVLLFLLWARVHVGGQNLVVFLSGSLYTKVKRVLHPKLASDLA